MIDHTKILRNLTDSEILKLKSDLLKVYHLWADHNPGGITALDSGKSIHLHSCDNDLMFRFSILEESIPDTYDIISSIVDINYLGRVYWHRLMQNDIIKFHTDSDISFVANKKLEHRYQIYLECPYESVLIIDNRFRLAKDFENTVVDFNLIKPHYYNNMSSTTWYFLVFDALNEPLKRI
jgi:hypothetical protein